MARSGNSKLKLLYLQKIFLERTDEEHGMTMPEIVKALEEYGISAWILSASRKGEFIVTM